MIFTGYMPSSRRYFFYRSVVDALLDRYPPFTQIQKLPFFQKSVSVLPLQFSYWEQALLQNIFLRQFQKKIKPHFFRKAQEMIMLLPSNFQEKLRMEVAIFCLYLRSNEDRLSFNDLQGFSPKAIQYCQQHLIEAESQDLPSYSDLLNRLQMSQISQYQVNARSRYDSILTFSEKIMKKGHNNQQIIQDSLVSTHKKM